MLKSTIAGFLAALVIHAAPAMADGVMAGGQGHSMPAPGGWHGTGTGTGTGGGNWHGGGGNWHGGNWHGGGNWQGGGHGNWNGNRFGGWRGTWFGWNGGWNDGWNGGGNGGWGPYYGQADRRIILPAFWLDPYFMVGNWDSFGLAPPPFGTRWIRYYDDAVLIDRYGVVYDRVEDVDWDRYGGPPGPDQVGPGPQGPHGPGPEGAYGHGPEGRMSPPHGMPYLPYQDEVITMEARPGWGGPGWGGMAYGGGYGGGVMVVPSGTVTTIVIQSQPVVTTTTETYYENVPRYESAPRAYAAPKARHRPKHRVAPKPRPRCQCR